MVVDEQIAFGMCWYVKLKKGTSTSILEQTHRGLN